GPGEGLCPCSTPCVASCRPAPRHRHRRGIGVAHGPRQLRRGPRPFVGTPALREAGLQAPARLPGAAACVAARFECLRRGGQRGPSVLGPSGWLCCVLSCFPLLRVAVATLQTGGRPGEALPRRSEGVRSRKQLRGPGGEMPNPLAFPPPASLQSLGPCDDLDGSRSRRRREGPEHTRPPPAPPLHPCAPPPGGPSPYRPGPGPRANLKAPAPHPAAPASAKAQTPAALRFGDGGDAFPCGLAPQGAGCRVQPCSPAPSSLRPVREHQGFGGAQRLQACRWTGEPRGPEALATFHWAGSSLSPSPTEQQDRVEAVRRGEARAPGDLPRDTRLGRRLAEQSLPRPLL
ncbi:unnamed protein product, partial [Gulo gulo]